MAISNKKKRELAEDLYINRGVSGKEISEQLDVSEQTICRWKKTLVNGMDWEQRRLELSCTPLKIKELLLREADNISRGNKPTIDADSLSKIMSAMDKVNKKLNPQVIFDVLCIIDKYVAEVDPEGWASATKYHKPILLHYIAMEGK